MLRRSLSVVLAATIGACPFVCTLSGAIAMVDGKVSHTCCDCQAQHSTDKSQPSDSDRCPPNSGKCCQCICGGAVSELGSVADIGKDVSWWTILPIDSVLVPSASDTAERVFVAQLQPDDGSNVGRSMRCLFMSFLC